MITFSVDFKKVSMSGYNKHYTTVEGTAVTCDAMRIVFDRAQQVQDPSGGYGSLPLSMSMGVEPNTVRILLFWRKTTKEMKTYAATLGRQVSCINNIFMPGMIVTITGSDELKGKWWVDTWSIDRTNSRGRKFQGEVTLLECFET